MEHYHGDLKNGTNDVTHYHGDLKNGTNDHGDLKYGTNDVTHYHVPTLKTKWCPSNDTNIFW